MTRRWILSVAEPRFANAVKTAIAEVGGDVREALQRDFLNPIDVTYYILQGEVPSAEVPLRIVGDQRYNFLNLQSEDRRAPNYFPDQAVLDVYTKLHKRVLNALLRLRRARARVTLFPV